MKSNINTLTLAMMAVAASALAAEPMVLNHNQLDEVTAGLHVSFEDQLKMIADMTPGSAENGEQVVKTRLENAVVGHPN